VREGYEEEGSGDYLSVSFAAFPSRGRQLLAVHRMRPPAKQSSVHISNASLGPRPASNPEPLPSGLIYTLKLKPKPCRGTSLIRDSLPIGPYSKAMPRALWWSYSRATPRALWWSKGGGEAVSDERGNPASAVTEDSNFFRISVFEMEGVCRFATPMPFPNYGMTHDLLLLFFCITLKPRSE